MTFTCCLVRSVVGEVGVGVAEAGFSGGDVVLNDGEVVADFPERFAFGELREAMSRACG